ncbi:MAG: hypothetical protein U9R34_07665 [Nanoarchaeota archaeon]|nr:hypothetical protein [Nanoarchaeota archaeon]
MKNYVLYTGKDETGEKMQADLEDDLSALVKRYGCDISTHFEIIQISKVYNFSRQIIKSYEIPKHGAINIQVSNHRDIKVGNMKVDGLVSCLGFVESDEYFQRLGKDLKQLCDIYHPDRTK